MKTKVMNGEKNNSAFQAPVFVGRGHGHPPSKKATKRSGCGIETELGIFPDITGVPIKKEFDMQDEGTQASLCGESNDCVTFNSEGLMSTSATQRVAAVHVDDNLDFISDVKVEDSKGPLETEPEIKMQVFTDNNYILAETEGQVEDSKLQVQGQDVQQGLPPTPSETVERDERGLKVSSSSRCIYCRFECSSRDTISKTKEKMDIHLARFHPEHYFPDVKGQVSGFMAKQFQRILVDFLFPEFIRKVGVYRACTLCAAKYDSLKWYDNDIFMRSHLAWKHETELRNRLSHILEDEAFEKKLDSCKSDGAWCRCGIYLTSPYLQKMHRRVYCNLNGSKRKKQKSPESQKNNVALSPPPSPKKPKKSVRETESGIFPDVPDVRIEIKTEFESDNKGTCFDHDHSDGLDADDIAKLKHKKDAGNGLLKTSGTQQVAALNGHYHHKSEIKLEESEDLLGVQPVVNMEVYSDRSYHVHDKLENDDDDEDKTNQVDAQDPLECHSHDPLQCDSEVVSGPNYMSNFIPVTAKNKLYCKLCSTILNSEDAFKHWNHYCAKRLRLPTNSEDSDHPSSTSTMKSRFANDHGTEVVVAKEADETYSLSCTYCRYVCRADISGFKKREELQLHQLRYHLEHFFLEEKDQLSGVKRKQFPRILVGFLIPQFIKKDGDFRVCTLCHERYLKSAWDKTGYTIHRKHLMMQHESELRERLKVILEDDRLEGKLMSCEKVEAWCRCGMYLPKCMETHKKLYCNLTARIPAKGDNTEEQDNCRDMGDRPIIDLETSQQKPPSSIAGRPQMDASTSTLECSYCSYKGMRRKLDAHTVRFHPEHYFPEEKDKASALGLKLEEFQKLLSAFVCSQFIRMAGRFSLCGLCDRKYSSADSYQRDINTRKHLIFEHKDELKEQLESIFDDIRNGGKLSKYI